MSYIHRSSTTDLNSSPASFNPPAVSAYLVILTITVTMVFARIHQFIQRTHERMLQQPLKTTFILLLFNYGGYRFISHWNPILERARIAKQAEMGQAGTMSEGTKAHTYAPDTAARTRVEAGQKSGGSSIQWMNVNGVPIPFIGPKSTD